MTEDSKIDGWRDMLPLGVGCWLIASPFILQFLNDSPASATTITLGLFIALISLLSIAKPQAWEKWADLTAAAALIVSPWAIDFVTTVEAATWNAMTAGTVLAVLVINSLSARQLPPATSTKTPIGTGKRLRNKRAIPTPTP